MENCKLYIITSSGKWYEPSVLEGIRWETARTGSPGKLTFTVLKTEGLGFHEGDRVRFSYDGTLIFVGYIFQKHRTKDCGRTNKEHFIDVTAYDQMRYLKNRTSYCMENVRADQVLKRIADDYHLKIRDLPNTGYVISKFNQSNQTLLDIILKAIDITAEGTKKLYSLYDDAGYLTLRDLSNSHTGLTISEETAEDFDYTSSIDSDTYNRVVVVDEEQKSGEKLVISEDLKSQERWGVLTNYVDANNVGNPHEYASNILKFHNRVSRALNVSGQFGNIKARAGTRIYLNLYLGDLDAKWDMVIDKATHIFNHGHYSMDLTLIGHEEFV